jgi:hypothetical protein
MYEILGLSDDLPCKKMSAFVRLLLLLWKLFSRLEKAVIISERYQNTKGEPIFLEKKEWSNSLLLECIKEKKELLVEVAGRSGLTSKETVKCSQELDVLLNVYQRQAIF